MTAFEFLYYIYQMSIHIVHCAGTTKEDMRGKEWIAS